jgi:type I restriction-modification system DNA methylase subunit
MREKVAVEYLDNFFHYHREEFSPQSIHRAKNLARFDRSWQLDFVDLGLMPLVEAEAGRKLQGLFERVVVGTKKRLHLKDPSAEQGAWLIKANFWLLAAKILKDKAVPAFSTLNLENLDEVFGRVAKHYGAPDRVEAKTKQQIEALQQSARDIASFSHLGLMSTEALAFLYENALISKETRAKLGTHSTPTYLVDYVVGKLRPWIEAVAPNERVVFEPACGHAAFLLAALRVLSELMPETTSSPRERHEYLRQHLFGCEIDAFALEIARLRLTLADVPNPNGWHLAHGNMFAADLLEKQTDRSMIILANPPFENFTKENAKTPTSGVSQQQHNNQATEMLARIVRKMKPGAMFGMVLPQSFLSSDDAAPVREHLVENFELLETCLFPDKVFSFADSESAVIIGRRLRANQKVLQPMSYRRVREGDINVFIKSYVATSNYAVPQTRFSGATDWSLFVPDLHDTWDYLKRNPQFQDASDIGQGFSFKSRTDPTLPKDAITESDRYKKGLQRGFVRLNEDVWTHGLPDATWINLDPSVILAPRHGSTTGDPKILLNYAPVSRGPWRLKGFINRKGWPFSSRFLMVKPRSKHWSLEAIWAICNSPVANAYSYAFSGKRDVLAGLMREMPIPKLLDVELAQLTKLVRKYLDSAKQIRKVAMDDALTEKLKILHWRVDAEVLRLYNLPVEFERRLLDLFSGIRRRGVPFIQTEYIQKAFSQPIRLHELLAITEDWNHINQKRSHLILKEERHGLSKDEAKALQNLQRLADLRIQLTAPLPIEQLETIAQGLRKRGIPVATT